MISMAPDWPCAALTSTGRSLGYCDSADIRRSVHPPERRQIVGSVFHAADREPYRRLNDAVCVCVGEVRAPADPAQAGPDLVMDVAELIWEPIVG
jgi:hypothetical protein